MIVNKQALRVRMRMTAMAGNVKQDLTAKFGELHSLFNVKCSQVTQLPYLPISTVLEVQATARKLAKLV